jgi:hypothetical protein
MRFHVCVCVCVCMYACMHACVSLQHASASYHHTNCLAYDGITNKELLGDYRSQTSDFTFSRCACTLEPASKARSRKSEGVAAVCSSAVSRACESCQYIEIFWQVVFTKPVCYAGAINMYIDARTHMYMYEKKQAVVTVTVTVTGYLL